MCPDCKGKGVYQGLGKAEPCRACRGTGGLHPRTATGAAICEADPWLRRSHGVITFGPASTHTMKKADSRRLGSIPLMTPLFEFWLYPETILAAKGTGIQPGIYLASRDRNKIPSSLRNMILILGSNEIHIHIDSYKPFP